MAQPIPAKLGRAVSFRTFSWLEMVTRSWGSAYREPDHGIYQFSDGRRFDSTDQYKTGLYNGGITAIADNPYETIDQWTSIDSDPTHIA